LQPAVQACAPNIKGKVIFEKDVNARLYFETITTLKYSYKVVKARLREKDRCPIGHFLADRFQAIGTRPKKEIKNVAHGRSPANAVVARFVGPASAVPIILDPPQPPELSEPAS
jgi:hypothetical protein